MLVNQTLTVQLRLASKGLAGSPRAEVQGDSPHSQHSNATGSPWSTVSSPDWHSTPRWPQYADFAAHSTRPANPSMLFHVTSAQPTMQDEHQLEVPCLVFLLVILPFCLHVPLLSLPWKMSVSLRCHAFSPCWP